MNNLNAPAAERSSAPQQLDPQKVLAWVDEDRLLIKDRTRHGLHRRVIARKGAAPNHEWVRAVSISDKVAMERIKHWYVEQDEFCYLWIFWKEKP